MEANPNWEFCQQIWFGGDKSVVLSDRFTVGRHDVKRQRHCTDGREGSVSTGQLDALPRVNEQFLFVDLAPVSSKELIFF